LASELTRLTREDASAEVWVGLDQLRGAVPADAVFIDFFCFPVMNFRPTGQASQWEPVRCAAWIIPPAGKGKVVLVDLGDLDKIEQAIARALEVLRDGPSARSEVEGMKTAQAALQRISKLILEPLLPHIGGTRRWIVSPDSQLWLVPWNALLLPDGEFVIEKHTVTHVVSARDLLRPAQERSNQPALALADPDYDLDLRDTPREEAGARAPISRGMLNARWPRLPGTAREISGIAPKLQTLTGRSPEVLTGEKAVEAAVKKARRPRILVLSTHGFFLGSQAPASGQELASIERGLKLEKPTTSQPAAAEEPLENPLLRCGLILAGANRRSEAATTDDGVLTGLEIVGADLRGTELVVLSACETGLGTLRQGEGVAGLRQAFHLAGAESVVATLWKIPDEETAQLMTSFFEHLASGKTRADALRQAQLTLIQSRRRQHGVAHPYWWAAFTLTDSTSR
jgi:CHAT domain-containing protein